jgi:hypothetical protein
MTKIERLASELDEIMYIVFANGKVTQDGQVPDIAEWQHSFPGASEWEIKAALVMCAEVNSHF